MTRQNRAPKCKLSAQKPPKSILGHGVRATTYMGQGNNQVSVALASVLPLFGAEVEARNILDCHHAIQHVSACKKSPFLRVDKAHQRPIRPTHARRAPSNQSGFKSLRRWDSTGFSGRMIERDFKIGLMLEGPLKGPVLGPWDTYLCCSKCSGEGGAAWSVSDAGSSLVKPPWRAVI
jgi:hypothetical protein